MSGIVDVVRNPLPIGAAPTVPSPSTPVVEVELLPLDMALKGSPTPETETYTVQLKKDELGLGITIAGYVCEKGYFYFITYFIEKNSNFNIYYHS